MFKHLYRIERCIESFIKGNYSIAVAERTRLLEQIKFYEQY